VKGRGSAGKNTAWNNLILFEFWKGIEGKTGHEGILIKKKKAGP
jgi:hypothetical protein